MQREELVQNVVPIPSDFGRVADELCEKALDEAKSQLHPLLQQIELNRLDQRGEFLEAFKSALEQMIARKLAAWQPSVQAVFKYDETRLENIATWDGSIHLLVKVPRLSNGLRAAGQKLDKSLLKYLRQMMWKRIQTIQSILDVHQVTPNELRHGIGYGAMFCAVYTAPVKIWPRDRKAA
jgi:hypothetical protein